MWRKWRLVGLNVTCGGSKSGFFFYYWRYIYGLIVWRSGSFVFSKLRWVRMSLGQKKLVLLLRMCIICFSIMHLQLIVPPPKKDYNLIFSEGITRYWHGSYINSYNTFFIQAIIICIHIQIALVLMPNISQKILRGSRQ